MTEEQPVSRELSDNELTQEIFDVMRRHTEDFRFTYEQHLTRIIALSLDAVRSYLATEHIPEELSDRIETAAMRAIQHVPLWLIDELEIAFTETVIPALHADLGSAIAASKRVALLWYDAFWPFEHPGAVAQAARWGNLANTLPAPVFMADVDGRITFGSIELDNLLGIVEGEVERRTLNDLFSIPLQVGAQNPNNVSMIAKGHHRSLTVTVLPMESPAGTEYFGFVRDRTQEVELSQVRDTIMNTISHELRTPLTAIKGYLELLSSGEIHDKDYRSTLAIISSESDRLESLVSGIVEFGKLASGTASLSPREVELTPAVRSAAEATGVEISSDVPEGLTVFADPTRVQQLLMQLLENAAIHGGDDVKVRAWNSSHGIEIEVSDNGSGMPFLEAGTAFQPFVYAASKNPGEGTGLGLAICQSIMEAHNGNLTVANRPGAHLTAWFPGPE